MNFTLMFGEWLRQRRDELGLTRKEFAKRVGCSVSTLRKIEDDERRPSGQIAELIANCLDIPAAERSTFVRVARGALNVDRLDHVSSLMDHSGISQSQTSSRTNLPALPTPLIGRQREVEELIRLLHDPQCHLLTLVGPGGIGKSRLAIETASRMQNVFPNGVYFIPLASVNSTRYITPLIADALGYTFESASRADPTTQLFNYLQQKQLLLLTDNLEHLSSEPGIQVLAELLAAAPQVKLLATSRRPIELQGEWIYEVYGLPVPENTEIEGVVQDTSIELFVQRARRAYAAYNATPEDLRTILRICRLVDGMPLAIELAAAWVRVLPCVEIAQEIERGLNLLSGSARDLPIRHRSMRAVFDHSWKLLTDEEQQGLLRLSVFRGGFQREAAEQVAGVRLSVLSGLVAKSIVRRSGDTRYDLHELIRQYALERCTGQPKVQKEAQKCHARYYLQYFGSRDASLRSSSQQQVIAELATEMDNFRSAWNWAIMHHEFTRAHQVLPTLWYLFELRAVFEEGEILFGNGAQFIESYAAESKRSAELLAISHEMRANSAYFLFRQGKTIAAYDALKLSMVHLKSNEYIHALLYLGIICRDLGRFAEAKESLLECLEKAEECHNTWYQSMAGQFLGIIALDKGEYYSAHRYLSQSLEVGSRMGDPMLTAHALGFLSLTMQAMGETTAAEKFLQESLVIVQKIGYRWGVGNALDGLGVLAQNSNPQEARRLFAASGDVYREIGDLRSLARALSHQAFSSLVLEDIVDARKSLTEALTLARQSNYMPYALDALSGFASLYAKQGNMEQALELSMIVLNHPAISKATRDRATRLRVELEAQLTPSQINDARFHTEEKTVESVWESMIE